MYAKYFKRVLAFALSLSALIVLSPVLLVLTVLGAIKMKGNPFFTQLRPGKDERIFRLVKFRSMTCQKDANGNLLPDEFFISVIGIATVCDDSGNCRTRDLCEGSAVWTDKADCDTF